MSWRFWYVLGACELSSATAYAIDRLLPTPTSWWAITGLAVAGVASMILALDGRRR